MAKKIEVNFYVWKHNKEEEELILRIAKTLEKEIQIDVTIEPKIIDLCVIGSMPAKRFTFVFGNKAKLNTEGNRWVMPPVKCLLPNGDKEKRKKAFNIIKQSAKEITNILSDPEKEEKQEEQLSIHLEKNDVSIGTKNTDFEIPLDIANYIKTMKELLGDCKVVITKGDIKVEME